MPEKKKKKKSEEKFETLEKDLEKDLTPELMIHLLKTNNKKTSKKSKVKKTDEEVFLDEAVEKNTELKEQLKKQKKEVKDKTVLKKALNLPELTDEAKKYFNKGTKTFSMSMDDIVENLTKGLNKHMNKKVKSQGKSKILNPEELAKKSPLKDQFKTKNKIDVKHVKKKAKALGLKVSFKGDDEDKNGFYMSPDSFVKVLEQIEQRETQENQENQQLLNQQERTLKTEPKTFARLKELTTLLLQTALQMLKG